MTQIEAEWQERSVRIMDHQTEHEGFGVSKAALYWLLLPITILVLCILQQATFFLSGPLLIYLSGKTQIVINAFSDWERTVVAMAPMTALLIAGLSKWRRVTQLLAWLTILGGLAFTAWMLLDPGTTSQTIMLPTRTWHRCTLCQRILLRDPGFTPAIFAALLASGIAIVILRQLFSRRGSGLHCDCGYPLFHTLGPTCPECGKEIPIWTEIKIEKLKKRQGPE